MHCEHDTEDTDMIHKRIAQRAYQIWEERGRPAGTEHENWIKAEREVEGEQEAELADQYIYTSAV